MTAEPTYGRGTLLWRQVAERLAGEIMAGVFRPGERLANERELAGRYAVHRHTLRRAIAELVQRGMLDVRHGSGTFVQPDPIVYRIGPQTRFQQSVEELNRSPGSRLLSSKREAAPVAIAERLGIEPAEQTVRLEILREIDGVPIMRSEHWFPAERVPAIAEEFERALSITVALRRLGIHPIRRRDSSIATRMPSANEARALRQAVSVPLLVWETLKITTDGVPIDYGVAVLAGERVTLNLAAAEI